MKLLLDMNLPVRWVDALAQAGHDPVHAVSLGLARAQDAEIMRVAHASARVVVTHDLDFGAILAATQGATPSVIQIRADGLSSPIVMSALLTAIRACEAELATGALLTVDAERWRVRLLPLAPGA